MPAFELTPEQESIAFKDLDCARIAAENGEKGAVFGQIGTNENGDLICEFHFIDKKRADKIHDIISGY